MSTGCLAQPEWSVTLYVSPKVILLYLFSCLPRADRIVPKVPPLGPPPVLRRRLVKVQVQQLPDHDVLAVTLERPPDELGQDLSQ